MSDEELIRRIKNGDTIAADTIIKRYYDKIYTFLCRKIGNKIEAQDFSILQQMKVQATYLSKWFYFIHLIISLFILCLLIFNKTATSTVIFFGMSPLFIILSIVVFYRTISDGMLELESSCKYGLSQIYAAKLLMLGIAVSLSIVLVWSLS